MVAEEIRMQLDAAHNSAELCNNDAEKIKCLLRHFERLIMRLAHEIDKNNGVC